MFSSLLVLKLKKKLGILEIILEILSGPIKLTTIEFQTTDHIWGCSIRKIQAGWKNPVRIRVRIDPPHPLICRKRRLNGAVLRMRPEKQRSRVTAGVARYRSLPAQRP
jgi:hypothetical protein